MRTCPRCGKNYEDDQAFCSKDGSTLTTNSGSSARHNHDNPDDDAQVLHPGTVIGQYRLGEVLGKGGMGIVYAAEHTKLGRKVAFKVLNAQYIGDQVLVQRFFHEARAAHTVGHENIVEVFDFIDDGSTRAYVMERLEGRPLTKDLEGERPLEVRRIYRIARQVADALAAVHEKGIVHRDLKPDNLFLTTRRRDPDFVKVLDFGVAKLLEATDGLGGQMRTQAGLMLGTPAYMSPEQLQGEDIDGRADIYSLGVILYQMVTGRRPFRGKTMPELMLKHINEPPRRPSTLGLATPIPAGLEELILQCLAKDRADRPKDMHELEARLVALESELSNGALATPNPVPTPAPTPAPKRTVEAATMELAPVPMDIADILLEPTSQDPTLTTPSPTRSTLEALSVLRAEAGRDLAAAPAARSRRVVAVALGALLLVVLAVATLLVRPPLEPAQPLATVAQPDASATAPPTSAPTHANATTDASATHASAPMDASATDASTTAHASATKDASATRATADASATATAAVPLTGAPADTPADAPAAPSDEASTLATKAARSVKAKPKPKPKEPPASTPGPTPKEVPLDPFAR